MAGVTQMLLTIEPGVDARQPVQGQAAKQR
jgi:hypothetical protein